MIRTWAAPGVDLSSRCCASRRLRAGHRPGCTLARTAHAAPRGAGSRARRCRSAQRGQQPQAGRGDAVRPRGRWPGGAPAIAGCTPSTGRAADPRGAFARRPDGGLERQSSRFPTTSPAALFGHVSSIRHEPCRTAPGRPGHWSDAARRRRAGHAPTADRQLVTEVLQRVRRGGARPHFERTSPTRSRAATSTTWSPTTRAAAAMCGPSLCIATARAFGAPARRRACSRRCRSSCCTTPC